MRHWYYTAALVALVAPACLPEQAKAQFPEQERAQERAQEADFSFFEESLSPYGEWVDVRGHGACWHPDVEEGWAPYTEGYWAYTDVGWTWVSLEPFGSIVFHYGRWLLTSGGWCWVPGADWAPAWVSWRRGGDYVGWAALPPEVPWHRQRGISAWVDVHTEIGPAYYRFCAVRDFCAPSLTKVLLRPTQNLTIMLSTQNVTNIGWHNNSVFCGGPEYRWIRERASLEVPLLRVMREENISRYHSMNVGGNFGTVQNFVYRDMLVLPAPARVEIGVSQRHRQMRSADVEVSRGWYGNAGANERLRSHLNQEWETREAAQRRNPAAFSGPAPEVRLKTVADQERRGVVAEVVARGEIAPPSARNPKSFSGTQDRGTGLFSGEQVREQPFRGKQGGVPSFANPGQSGPPSKESRAAGDSQTSVLDRATGRTAPAASSNPPLVEPVLRSSGVTGDRPLTSGSGGASSRGVQSTGTTLRNEGVAREPTPGGVPTRSEGGRLPSEGGRFPSTPGVQNGGRVLSEGVPSSGGNMRPQTLPREETPAGISGFQGGGRTEPARSGNQAPSTGAVGGNGGRSFPANPANTGANFPGGNPSQGGGGAPTR
ncbi:MAG: hypothetical protein DVB28_000824, partial [Verrucomicrobia bacterium]